MTQVSLPDQMIKNIKDWQDQLKANNQSQSAESIYQLWSFLDKPVNVPQAINKPVVGFLDEPAPAYTIDARIWIQGVEFSGMLKDAVSVGHGDEAGDSECSFTLINPDDALVYTYANLKAVLELDGQPEKFTEPKKANLVGAFNDNERIKEKMLNYKLFSPQNKVITGTGFSTPVFPAFPVMPNIPCVQKMDPIRVFIPVPNLPKSMNLWMPVFTGYVDDVGLEDDELNGTSSISVTCKSIKAMVLARMRLSVDFDVKSIFPPTYVFGLDPSTGESKMGNSIFYDQSIPSEYGQPFVGLSVEETLRLLLVTNAEEREPRAYDPRAASLARERKAQGRVGPTGVRFISDAGLYEFDPGETDRSKRTKFLEDWHRLVLFGAKRRPWTESEMKIVGDETKTDGSYATNACRLWRLVPSTGSGPRNLQDLTGSSATATDPTWSTRLQVLTDVVKAAQCQFFVSPTGDLFLEFDMTDFRPEDFGEFSTAFKYVRHVKSVSIAEEQGSLPCGVIATTGYDNRTGSPGEQATDKEAKAAAYSPTLAMRFGVETETLNLPFLLRDVGTAANLCAIELSHKLSDANQMTVVGAFRPFLAPNRPIEHVRRGRIGKSTNIAHVFTPMPSPMGTTTVTVNHVRRWTGYKRDKSTFSVENLSTPRGEALKAAVAPVKQTTPTPAPTLPARADPKAGVDYSGTRPGGAALRAAGKTFAVRYVPYGGTAKGLTNSELTDLLDNNISVALVFERLADDPRHGFTRGVEMAKIAQRGLNTLMLPHDLPIYFAADYGNSETTGKEELTPRDLLQIDSFLRGCASVIGATRVGIYGGLRVIEHCATEGTAVFFWQSQGLSSPPRKTISSHAHLVQVLGTISIGGARCDANTAIQQNFGQYTGPPVNLSDVASVPATSSSATPPPAKNVADPDIVDAANAQLMAGALPNARVYETITGGESTPLSRVFGWAPGTIAPNAGIITFPPTEKT